MSKRQENDETVADRVEKLIDALPPKEGRNSRIGHISIEDFADLVGTSKQRVIDWRKGTGFPDEKNRERLAAVSGGIYVADDFRKPTDADQQLRLGELSAEVDDLTAATVALVRVVTVLCERAEASGAALPADAIEELARAGLRIQHGARRR